MKLNINLEIIDGSLVIDAQQLILNNVSFIEEIGRGANGVVFLAIDTLLHRHVAVKVWIQSGKDHRNKLKQGLMEARKVASLIHENIVTVYSASIHHENVFSLTTEYLNGITLREYLETSPDVSIRLRIWYRISDAIQYAHASGTYHGDLHTGNVILVGEDPKIIDFGTSIFAGEKEIPRKREVKLLLELVSKLFPEWDQELLHVTTKEVWDKPEMILNHCIRWVELFKLYTQFISASAK